MSTLVLGIGDIELCDEGIGVHATRYLLDHYPELKDTFFLDGGTLSFPLAAPFEDSQNLIIIDAARLDDRPGTMKTFVGTEIDDYLHSQTKHSVQEVGLMDLMPKVRLSGYLPQNRALIAIQPNHVGWGDLPSEELQAAIPKICERAVGLIADWQV